MKNIKNLAQGILFLFVILNLSSCDTVSEKHVQLEVYEKQLNADIKLYTSVWDKIINDRQIDLINEDAFDLNVTCIFSFLEIRFFGVYFGLLFMHFF